VCGKVPYVIVKVQSFECLPVPWELPLVRPVNSPLVRCLKSAMEACRVTHPNVCQTEQMSFLRRNTFVVVLPRANRGSILRNARYVVAAVRRVRSGGIMASKPKTGSRLRSSGGRGGRQSGSEKLSRISTCGRRAISTLRQPALRVRNMC
jgi:hypothetical protein